MKKFKSTLRGKRIILKRTEPNLRTAKIIFETIEINRKHLAPWFEWEKLTKKVEDTLKYLFDKENLAKTGKKIEYGIYIENNYAGNIGVFDINMEYKSAEIGYWLSTEFIRQGIMTEAVGVLEKEFFENFNINRIQIKCDEKNIASAGVAKKSGYKLEGILREDSLDVSGKIFRNTKIFSKLLSEYKSKK